MGVLKKIKLIIVVNASTICSPIVMVIDSNIACPYSSGVGGKSDPGGKGSLEMPHGP
jgi:hypothetical protein